MCSLVGRAWGSVRQEISQSRAAVETAEAAPVASLGLAGALGSLCRHYKRLPEQPPPIRPLHGLWKRLETQSRSAGLQAAASSVKHHPGNTMKPVSTKNTKNCRRGGVRGDLLSNERCWQEDVLILDVSVYGPFNRCRRKRGSTDGQCASPAHSLSQEEPTRAVWSPPSGAHSATEPREERHQPLCAGGAHAGVPTPSRVKAEAAFRTPNSSTEPSALPIQSDSDPEPVGAGIQHLQKLSQELEEAIMAEERKQALSDRQVFVLKDVYASP
uniref:PICALM interacting mitotic regulator n=1 Tax=Macaca nemestrina TaxID=9545 RepID=A0A2K6DX47_MACNE